MCFGINLRCRPHTATRQLSLRGFVKNARPFAGKLCILAHQIQQVVETATDLKRILNNALSAGGDGNSDVAQLTRQLQKCLEYHNDMSDLSNVFIAKVEKTLEQCVISKKQEKAIKAAVREGKYRKLNAYVTKISQRFVKCRLAYNCFNEDYSKVLAKSECACEEGIALCQRKQKEARENQKDTEHTGYGFTAAAAVVSAICGIITIATAGAAAPATGAMTGLIAAGAGAITYYVARQYGRAAEEFGRIKAGFASISEKSSDIGRAMEAIYQALGQTQLDMVSQCSPGDEESYEAFCEQFDDLTREISDTFDKVHETKQAYKINKNA